MTQPPTNLSHFPITKIDKVAGIDYSLVAPPAATAQSLDMNLKGEFFSLAHHSAIPFPPPALALPVDHDRMVYCGASSYFFNTAGFVYHTAGALLFEITDAMIPKEFKFHLNTSTFSAFIPQVNKLMKLMIKTSSAPFLTITPGNLSLMPVVDIQAYVILPNSSFIPVFLLSVVISVFFCRLQLSLKHSDVGPFSVSSPQRDFTPEVTQALLGGAAGLKEGFPLPLPARVQLSNLVIQPRQNFLLFGADVRYV
uniref:Bactericidal permeability-increasing protein n=1 Tax=Chelonoidis abingdonii TaxID=106734 RepID=A0A8C0ILU8_CHEAB